MPPRISQRLAEKTKISSSRRFGVWIEQSRYDLEVAQVSYDNRYYEWTCYQSIQSVEKIIKAVIVQSGYRPPKIHKLGILLGIANRANENFVTIKINFRKIEAYTFISRYPFIVPGENKTPHEMITRDDAEICLRLAQDVFNTILDFIKTQKLSPDKDIYMEDYYFSIEEVDARIRQLKELPIKCEKMEIGKIILFGSFAREKVRPRTTTMDVLIVAKTDLPFFERIHYVREATRGDYPIIEPVVYTSEEFQSLLVEEGEGYLESAVEEGVTLYEKV